MNHAYSVDESSETTSTPFDVDSSSYSELEQEPYKFSTFLEDPQPLKLVQDDILNDPTQVRVLKKNQLESAECKEKWESCF